MEPFIKSVTLMVVLLNPFLMSLYLADLIDELDNRQFTRVLTRGAIIATTVFVVFALTGDAFFSKVLQVRFASFLIFGGVIFLVIALRYFSVGAEALRGLRGDPQFLEGSVAMPFMIGPGTISASVLTGLRLPAGQSIIAILTSMVLAVGSLWIFKTLLDYVRRHNETLLRRYYDIVGRFSAFIIGSIAVEMIVQGWERISSPP